MNRAEKIEAVEQLSKIFNETPHLILAGFRGLKANDANELRRKIGGMGGRYGVVKSRLAKRAAAGTPAEGLIDAFDGPCALAAHDTDPVSLAKTMSEFAKGHPQIEILAGMIDARDVVDASGVKQLASLPSMDQLRGQLLSLIQTPATTLVRLINTPGAQLARVIDARREAMGEGSGGRTSDASLR